MLLLRRLLNGFKILFFRNFVITLITTNETFKSIIAKIDNTMKLISKATLSSHEQKLSIAELESAISEVDKITQNNTIKAVDLPL